MDSVRAGGATITYAYNAYGQLVRRNGHGVKRYFLWDQGQLLAELDSTATHRVGEYAYAPGTDAPIALVTGSGTVQQVVQDVNGNVIGLFTGSSTITERETYAPWGTLETGALTTLADTNRLRWKGLVWEGDSTQLYYVRARRYDPVSRRFVSEDPLGIEGGTIRTCMAGITRSRTATRAACCWTTTCATSGGSPALQWTVTLFWVVAV